MQRVSIYKLPYQLLQVTCYSVLFTTVDNKWLLCTHCACNTSHISVRPDGWTAGGRPVDVVRGIYRYTGIHTAGIQVYGYTYSRYRDTCRYTYSRYIAIHSGIPTAGIEIHAGIHTEGIETCRYTFSRYRDIHAGIH